VPMKIALPDVSDTLCLGALLSWASRVETVGRAQRGVHQNNNLNSTEKSPGEQSWRLTCGAAAMASAGEAAAD
jgi:hypothetical protein